MGLLDRKFSKDNTVETIDTLDSNSVNFMSKFFRYQKTSFSQPPETLYENEAWAPEAEFVGLFRKRRVNAEVKPSPASSPQ